MVARFEEVQSAYADRVHPPFSEAMVAAEEAGGVLLVWAIDRFSRTGAEGVLWLFPRSGGRAPFRLVSLDGVDTSREEARFQTIIKAELAPQESERIGARIRRARVDARKNGRWISGNAPCGIHVAVLEEEWVLLHLEVRVMEYVRSWKYPVPEVHRVEGRHLVMDKVDGPTMLEALERSPWRVLWHAWRLARLSC